MAQAQRHETLLFTLAQTNHERLDNAGARAPGHMEAGHRVAVLAGRIAAALGPADDGKPAHASGSQPGALLAGCEADVGCRPLARPMILLAVEAGRSQPVLQREVVGIANAHAPLFGAVDKEQPAERP